MKIKVTYTNWKDYAMACEKRGSLPVPKDMLKKVSGNITFNQEAKPVSVLNSDFFLFSGRLKMVSSPRSNRSPTS